MKDTPNTHCTAIIIVARIDNQYEKKMFSIAFAVFFCHTLQFISPWYNLNVKNYLSVNRQLKKIKFTFFACSIKKLKHQLTHSKLQIELKEGEKKHDWKILKTLIQSIASRLQVATKANFKILHI